MVRLTQSASALRKNDALFWYVVKKSKEEEDATKRNVRLVIVIRGDKNETVATHREMEEIMETATLRRSTRREKEEETTSWTWNCTWRRAVPGVRHVRHRRQSAPDVRDGLAPVHRRTVYAMHELNLDHNKPFKKCARVVGEVLGKFHPHGDQSVYDALVRMAQDFSMSAPLVNGHGNFGSMDNDPPAAMRYTECKLRQLSQDMLLKDVEMDCVEFADTFDGSQQEPMVLPAKLPNVLINGSTGIAVGMATSIPPHNLMEVADALVVFARAAQKEKK